MAWPKPKKASLMSSAKEKSSPVRRQLLLEKVQQMP